MKNKVFLFNWMYGCNPLQVFLFPFLGTMLLSSMDRCVVQPPVTGYLTLELPPNSCLHSCPQ